MSGLDILLAISNYKNSSAKPKSPIPTDISVAIHSLETIFSVPHLSEFAQGVAFRLHLQVISLLHLSSSCYKVLGNIAKHTPEKNVKMLTHYPK